MARGRYERLDESLGGSIPATFLPYLTSMSSAWESAEMVANCLARNYAHSQIRMVGGGAR